MVIHFSYSWVFCTLFCTPHRLCAIQQVLMRTNNVLRFFKSEAVTVVLFSLNNTITK